MNSLTLVDGSFSDDFFPFSLTRTVADIRCGILTIREKWNIYLKNEPAISGIFSFDANIIPDPALIRLFSKTKTLDHLQEENILRNPVDILRYNDREIKNDFLLITRGRISAPISSTNKITGTSIFMEPGAIVEHCILNSDAGPIYIGKDAHLMEGSMIRGPFAIGEKGLVKMGAKIYGATSAGPYCILGGEIKNSVFFGYSNKSHDGYLGDSVLGEWCNLGAGSSNSNLKNSAGNIKLWNPVRKSFLDGGTKCGLMMGDYSRAAINTSFSTGTVTGVCCHVFGNGPTPAYLPSFSWGFNGPTYIFDKAVDHINKWKKLKGLEISAEEIEKLKNIFDQEKQYK